MSKVIIDAESKRRFIDLEELWQYRDTLYFIVRRDIRIRYAQSVLGIGWAIANPFVQMIIFTVIFGNLARINSDGAPYAVFSFTALVPWNYFSNALTGASNSMINSVNMINKVYFPRIILPLSPVIKHLIDLVIAFSLLLILMLFYGIMPTIFVLVIPYMILMMMVAALGAGMLLAALAVQYRDVAYAMEFAVTVLMYLSPVIYPVSMIPSRFRFLYGLNPMVGVIEGFRSALLNTNPMPWDLLLIGTLSTMVLLFIGVYYFHKREYLFADVA